MAVLVPLACVLRMIDILFRYKYMGTKLMFPSVKMSSLCLRLIDSGCHDPNSPGVS